MDLRSIRRVRPFGIKHDFFEGIDVYRCSFPLGNINRKVFHSFGINQFKKVYLRAKKEMGNFDIVHAHFLEISYITVKLLKEFLKDSTPVVVTEHSSSLNKDFSMLDENTIEEGNFVYHNVDKVIAVSHALARKLHDNFGVNCDVVYNVFDSKLFSLPNVTSTGGVQSKKDFVLVSAANLNKNKRMAMLVDAFLKTFKDDHDSKLYIFGDGPERGSIEEIIKKNNAKDKIILFGKKTRNEMAKFYNNADAFVLLSERETFGVSYIEAMAAGLPVIASYSGGPESFVNDKVGILIRDEEDICKCLKTMKNSVSNYDRKHISKYAKEICSPEVIAKQLSIIYQSILDEK
jgi:glycosyltransferase involved in cell wall biosynthesis